MQEGIHYGRGLVVVLNPTEDAEELFVIIISYLVRFAIVNRIKSFAETIFRLRSMRCHRKQ